MLGCSCGQCPSLLPETALHVHDFFAAYCPYRAISINPDTADVSSC